LGVLSAFTKRRRRASLALPALLLSLAGCSSPVDYPSIWSDAQTKVYSVETPVITPASGTYNSAQAVTLSCAASDAVIYYTTNGNDPTASSSVYGGAIPVAGDGTITTIKAFAAASGRSDSAIARADITLHYPGTLDAAFPPGTGADSSVRAICAQSDGHVLIGGFFTSYSGATRNRVARLNADGSLDGAFDSSIGADSDVYALAVQSDGRIVLCGAFTAYNGTARNRVARLNADGTLDGAFDSSSGANTDLYSLAVQGGGRVIIGGMLITYDGTPRNCIARVNSDGSLDAGFDPGTGANSSVYSIFPQSDGKILIVGGFNTFNGTSRSRLARVNADGSLDTGFSPAGPDNETHALAVQSDGKFLIGGYFVTYNGTARNHVTRVNADGSLDTGFDPGTGADGAVLVIAVQDDGKVLIGGGFTTYNGMARNRLARLNADGSLDATFDYSTGADSTVRAIAVQSDGKILVGGDFTAYNGATRNYLVRLWP
jgi:uncharacterized delta-60 repeat protein